MITLFLPITFTLRLPQDNPVPEMGRAAANLVLKDIYKKSGITVTQVFEPKLILRDSTPDIN